MKPGPRFIFELSRIGATSWDEVLGFVIVAESEEVAREIASTSAVCEGARTWTDPARSECEMIGYATRAESNMGNRIVLRSFKAG